MAQIDLEEVKRISANSVAHPGNTNHTRSNALAKNQKTIRNTFQSYFKDPAAPIDELTKLRASRQLQIAQPIQGTILTENAKGFPAREAGFANQ